MRQLKPGKFTSYRQVFTSIYNFALRAIRVVDVSEETLHTWGTSQVIVGTTEKTLKDWFENIPPETRGLNLKVISGGPIYVNSALTKNPSGGGAEGSDIAFAGDTIKVRGFDDVQAFNAIRETNGVDAVVNAALLVRSGA